jgi:FMN-dependent NADH-azoreductase
MPTLLQIDVSSRGDYSISRKLSAAFAEQWQAKNPGGTVTRRDLTKTQLTFVDMDWIGGAYSSPDQHTPEHKQALKLSDELIGELLAADEIVIGTPMYNFGVPAALKAWIDHIVRIGKTFNRDEQGYHGLVLGKKATFLIASGGNYAAGAPAEKYNQETPYLTSLFGFLGVTDTKAVHAGDTTAVMMGQVSMDEYLKPHVEEVKAAV